jgi:hypothetical protein
MKANPLTAHVVCGELQLWTFRPDQFMRLIENVEGPGEVFSEIPKDTNAMNDKQIYAS